MKVYLPAIESHVPTDMVHTVCDLLDFRYLVCHNIIDPNILDAIKKKVESFHKHHEVFIHTGVCENWNLPCMNALKCFVWLIKKYSAPNGLCSLAGPYLLWFPVLAQQPPLVHFHLPYHLQVSSILDVDQQLQIVDYQSTSHDKEEKNIYTFRKSPTSNRFKSCLFFSAGSIADWYSNNSASPVIENVSVCMQKCCKMSQYTSFVKWVEFIHNVRNLWECQTVKIMEIYGDGSVQTMLQ